LRTRLGIRTREVADLSQRIADAEGNPEFPISKAWLTQVENSDAVPGIHKLYSLSAIYRTKITDLFLLFGIDLAKPPQHQRLSPLARTHLTTLEVADAEQTVQFPLRFDPSFDLRHTNLLSRMVEVWGRVPIGLVQGLDIRHNLYGYIGLEDYTLFPILRPGCFVQIDPRVRKILPGRWLTEYHRPIYFIESRDGTAVRGANCRTSIFSCCPTRDRPPRSGDSPTASTERLSGRSHQQESASRVPTILPSACDRRRTSDLPAAKQEPAGNTRTCVGRVYFFGPLRPLPPSSSDTTNRSSSMLIVTAVTRPTTETSSGKR
jgi:transcriptional regulator with XRE-family HTH domain